MPVVISKDGTTIAYDKTGSGPAVVLVNGALGHRKFFGEQELVNSLAKNFTVIHYDRRGRGESSDTKPYAAEKEIEDLDVLIQEAGGSAYVFGTSSGAALSFRAAEKLGDGKIKRLALYEPPYGAANEKEFVAEKKKINELIAAGKAGDAVAFFFENRGTPPAELESMKQSPAWSEMVRTGHTLVYDFEILGNGTVPLDVAKQIKIPTLVIDGEKSYDFMHATADTLAKNIAGAQRKTLKDQTHQVSPEAIGPVLQEFFLQ